LKTRASLACKRKSRVESGASTLGVPFRSRVPWGGAAPQNVYLRHTCFDVAPPSHDRRDYYKSHYCTPAARRPEANLAYINRLSIDLIARVESISCRLVCDDREGKPPARRLLRSSVRYARCSCILFTKSPHWPFTHVSRAGSHPAVA
jgi:hypothetical protein